MIQINQRKTALLAAAVFSFLLGCSQISLAAEAAPSLAEQYIQQEEAKETFLDKAYNTHAQTITHIFMEATEDLRGADSQPSESQPQPVEKTPQPAEKEPVKYIINLSKSEVDLLVRVVYAESGNEPFDGQVAVAATIINRICSPKFPNTLTQVVYSPNQFTVVKSGAIKRTPSATAYKAVDAAMQGKDPSKGGLYFWNPRVSKGKFFKSLTRTATIGSHAFGK